jgi:DNA-binding XRE family transcriptional regulator
VTPAGSESLRINGPAIPWKIFAAAPSRNPLVCPVKAAPDVASLANYFSVAPLLLMYHGATYMPLWRMTLMEPSKFVKQARMRLALTQIELGQKLGRRRASIIRYEQGDDVPPAILLAIEQLLAEYGSPKRLSKDTQAKLELLHAMQKENVKKRKRRK